MSKNCIFRFFTLLFLFAGSTGYSQKSQNSHKIFFISDFQAPLDIEKVILRTFRNEDARDSLFADLIRKQPENLVLTGDMVSAGSRQKSWLPLDSLLGSLKKSGTKVNALPGNHEYMFSQSTGIKNFNLRFAEMMSGGYMVTYDSIAVMMINSNFGNLSENQYSRQLKWYASAMDSLDSDPATRAIIVCTHHAPYSNSAVVGSSEAVKNLIVPAYEKSKKSVLFISGHSHNLEYFAGIKGKHYLVIGGGGGITQPLLPMDKRTNNDMLQQESKPVYFYVIIEKSTNHLKISARGFKKDFRFFDLMVDSANIIQQLYKEQTKKTIIGDTVSELDKTIFIVFQASNNDYWFGSDGQGVFRYDGKTILHFATKDGLCNNRIREIKEDKSGNIFFTTLEGISKFDGQKFTTLPVIESNEWKLEPDDLWFNGGPGKNGPYRYDGKSLYHLEFPKHYLADEFYMTNSNPPYNPYEVYTIYEDSKGILWFGTSNFGICRFDGKTLSWMYEKHLTEIEGGGQFCIRSIIEDKEGKFWFCNTSYRYNILSGSLIEQDKILINYKREKGIVNVKSPEGKDMIYFMSVIEDNKGDLWMVTYEQGVWRYDGKTLIHYSVKDGSRDIKLFSIYKDKQGKLWLGTHEAGACKFNGHQFEKFSP